MKLNTCGKHYGNGGECSKCKMFASQRANNPKAYQYDGTPWIAAIHPAQPESIQDKAIEAAHLWNSINRQ